MPSLTLPDGEPMPDREKQKEAPAVLTGPEAVQSSARVARPRIPTSTSRGRTPARGRDMPAAGRHPTGAGAGSHPGAGGDGGADRRAPGDALHLLPSRQPVRRPAPPDAAGDAGLEPRPAASGSSACCVAYRFSQADGPLTPQSRSAAIAECRMPAPAPRVPRCSGRRSAKSGTDCGLSHFESTEPPAPARSTGDPGPHT